jgi:thiosulfate/3-mercaptopyruvate sulfurtransferase
VQIVDARSAERFAGKAPEPRPGLRSGHMPGSFNVPFDRVLDNGNLASRERVEAAFRNAGVDLDKPIITSCGSGMTAAILTFALDSIGRTAQGLYDGSWTEWGGRPDLPVERD